MNNNGKIWVWRGELDFASNLHNAWGGGLEGNRSRMGLIFSICYLSKKVLVKVVELDIGMMNGVFIWP